MAEICQLTHKAVTQLENAHMLNLDLIFHKKIMRVTCEMTSSFSFVKMRRLQSQILVIKEYGQDGNFVDILYDEKISFCSKQLWQAASNFEAVGQK